MVSLGLLAMLATALPVAAAQPPRPDPLVVECDGETITVE